ncbi:sec-independent translocation protein mttA/Hcf106 [Anaeromyxobacter dehalogenans 2CP-1]|uniref:Sec-independent protein translocase protein TatA n=1 Tax=Anaeromyxobacter dehalogenans (strain ATCC BAA-258 / DSM 21875 / 2CP-1) TaxID=455488 RepID=B8J7U4_ANAD2|nr:twin-arginine translocase TatA/TatE family subunit [Anaeromyxobacter dehalogenans]ACL63436.1 sec-independent translocation protein mttA/Hcf106 [Anaeromyxobacter dehalogenans 2CP-1]
MFGLSFGEIVIIAVLALILLGPDRLPEAAKTIGKGLRQFKQATDDLKDQIETEIYKDDRKVARPSLVPPVPNRPVPGPAGPPPAATAENVPGLEAALVDAEPAAPPAEPAVPAAAPAPTPSPAPSGEGAPPPGTGGTAA